MLAARISSLCPYCHNSLGSDFVASRCYGQRWVGAPRSISALGQKLKSSSRADDFCSSLNSGHQDHGYIGLVPIGRPCSFRPQKWVFCFKKTGIFAYE
jgi:hypothetical protein